MKGYKIYEHPCGEIEIVKNGWSWPAFWFTWIWAMVKKLWPVGLIALFGIIIINFIDLYLGVNGPDSFQMFIIVSGIYITITGIIFGTNGNHWREENAVQRGYILKGYIEANNVDHAKSAFLTNSINQIYINNINVFGVKKLTIFMVVMTIISIFVYFIGTYKERSQKEFLLEQRRLEEESKAIEKQHREIKNILRNLENLGR